MSTRRLEVVITGDSKSLSRAFGQTSRDLDQMDGRAKRTGRAFAGFGASILRGGAVAAVTAFAGATALGTRELLAQEKASARTRNVLETMGSGAGVTAKEVEDLASSLQDQTGTADDAIQASQNLLLTFKNIKDEDGPRNTFARATAAANDMSVALGTDLQSTTIQLGKALNEPSKGALALAKSGSIARSDLEKLQGMAEAGVPIWKQQEYLLSAVERQFKGAASSEGEATEALQQFQRGAEDAAEGLAARLLPMVMSVVESFQRHWPQIRGVTERAFNGARDAAARAMAWFESNILPTIQAIVGRARAFWARFGDDIRTVFALALRIVQRAMTNIREAIELVLAVLRGDWGEAWQSLTAIVRNVISNIVDILRTLAPVAGRLALAAGKAIALAIVRGVTGLAASLSKKVTGAVSSLAGAVASAAATLGGKFADAFIEGIGNLAARAANKIPGVNIGGNRDDGSVPGSAEERLTGPRGQNNPNIVEIYNPNATGSARAGLNFMLARVPVGSPTDLTRFGGRQDRQATIKRSNAERAARAGGEMDEGKIRDAGERAYLTARKATIVKIKGRIKTARNRLVAELKKVNIGARMKVKVPKAPAEKRKERLEKRARMKQRQEEIQGELESLAADWADLTVESREVGDNLEALDRGDEATDDGGDTPTPTGDVDAGPTPGDYLDAAAAQAALTEGLDDDIAAADAIALAAHHAYNAAVAGGDPRAIASTAQALAAARQNAEQLRATRDNTDAVNANTEAQKQSFQGSVSFGYRGQGYVLGTLGLPSSDRLTGMELLV